MAVPDTFGGRPGLVPRGMVSHEVSGVMVFYVKIRKRRRWAAFMLARLTIRCAW